MTIPRFDVFSGLLDKDARWIESIEGLGAAHERIKELAAATQIPGDITYGQLRLHPNWDALRGDACAWLRSLISACVFLFELAFLRNTRNPEMKSWKNVTAG